ncbi:MAG TPA: TolC family protein, partial [Prolixibacteraceae bacterium]|nr:TolC family protein [Prolixibacteraceae bacterium]
MKQFCLIIFFISTLFAPAAGKAADTLRLADAVVLALENNFSISLAENNLKIAETGNSLGNAGMLPVLGLTGSRSLAINNSKQIYYDGRTREGKDAKTNNQSAGLQLNWTFF